MVLVVSPNLSVLVSIWMETLFYGINTFAYLLCIYVFLSRRYKDNRMTAKGLIVLSTMLFLVATAHVGVNLCRLIEGYVNPPTKAAMTAYLLDITQVTNVTKQFLVVLGSLLSEVLIIWRVYIVWGRQWLICILPMSFSLGVVTCGTVAAVYISLVIPGQSIFLKSVYAWATAQISLSLATNVTATMLIAGRIWYITRDMRSLKFSSTKQYSRVIVIVIESASFAAVGETVQLAFYAAKFPGVYFVSDSVVQIVCMAPLLIIVFVGLTSRGDACAWGSTYSARMPVSKIQFEERHVRPGDHPKDTASDNESGMRSIDE